MRIRLIIVNPCAIPGSHITSAVTDDMNSRHIIERAVFDLSFGSEEEAFQQQSDLSDFIKGRLMRVVDEVFGEMSTDGKVFRIDQLEIDLGTVAYNGFQDEMESRLRERLRNVLREKLLSVRSAPTPDERVITRERMELEQTEHFLTTGRMPWNVMLGEGRTVDQLLQQVVHSTGAELVEFLKTSPRRDTVVKRLVSQFPDAILAEIIRMLAPSHSGFLTSLVDDLRRICRKSGFVEAAEREFGRFVREQIIHELLETGEAFNPRDLVRRIMIRISQGQRGNYPRLLTTLAGESAQLEKEGGIGPELTGILQTLLRREAPPGDTESRSRALIHSYDLYETLRQRMIEGASLREDGDLTRIIDELARAYPWQLLRLYRELQADGRSIARMAASLSVEELGRLVEAFLSLTQQSEETEPSDLRRAMEAYASQAVDVKRYYGQILECLVMNQTIDFEAIIAERRPSDDAGDRDSDESVDGSVPERLTEPQEEDMLPPGEPAEEALARYLKEGGKVSPDDIARLVDMVEFMLAHQPGRLRRLLESSLDEREAAARLIQLLPERLLTRVVFLIRPSAYHRLQQCADILASACYSRELAVEPDRVRRMKWQYIFRYLLEEGLPYDEGAFARGLAGYLAEETKQADAKAFIALLSQQLALNILPSTREQHLAIVKALSQTTGEEALEVRSRTDEEDARSVSREMIRSYDLYEALRQRLIEGESFKEGGDLTRVMDELARAYPWQLLRLYRELQTRELTGVQTAAALSVGELSHLIRAFLTLPQQDGEDLSDLMSAIEAHAEQAADMKRYYGQVLECLLLNQVIDFEAIIAESQSSAEAGEEPEPPSVSLGELASYLREGGRISPDDATRLMDMVEFMLARQPGQFRRLLKASLDEREAAARIIEILPERLLTRVLFLLRPAEHHRVQQCADILASACYASGLAVETDRIRRMKWEYIFRYLLEEGLPYDEITFARGLAGYLAEETKQVDAKAFIAFLSQQLALNILPATREHHLAIVKALSPNTAETEGKKKLEEQNVVEQAAEGRVDERADESDDRTSTAADTDSISRSLIHSYDLYEALRQRLLQDILPGEGGEGDMTRIIDELASAYPWQLLRLYRELQARELTGVQAAAALSAEELSHLIRAFLTLPQQDGEDRSDLMSAIEAHAEQAADEKRYYGQVLECLLLNQIIDFEAIIAESQSSAEAVGKPEPSSGLLQEQTLLSLREAEEELAGYLKEGGKLSAADAARLIHTVEFMLARQSGRLRQLLKASLDEREAAARIIEILPERLLTRVLFLLRPAEHHRVQQCADILAHACYASQLAVEPDRIRRLKWQYIFRYLLEEGLPYDEVAFARGFAGYLAEETKQMDAKAFIALLSQQLALNILPSTREQHLAIMKALSQTTGEGPLIETVSQRAESSHEDRSLEEEEQVPAEDIYIANAGQVLAAPYLPRLFAMLDLTEGTAFKDRKAAERAVHLLQFMVNESTNSPEYQLVLNKILCGIGAGVPIERQIDITDREEEAVEGLIQGMIQNWKVIGNTSIAGLRESFLQREGRLQLKDDAWHLLVEPRPYDMLLDQIPWSFSIIKHPWMERIVHVEWR